MVLKRGMECSRACLFVTSFSLGLDFFLFLAHLTYARNVIMSCPLSVVIVFIIVVTCGFYSLLTFVKAEIYLRRLKQCTDFHKVK